MPAMVIAAVLNHFETEHRTNAKFHAAVIMLDQVVQIFR